MAETSPVPRPTPCRVLIYGWTGGASGLSEQPAMVTRVLPDGRVDLDVFGCGRHVEAHAVNVVASPMPGSAWWPPRG